MVSPQHDELPVGHAARPVVRTALVAAVLNAVVFTVFAYTTTQVKPVRHVSPWQDDPYDTVVSFTMFFVPIITVLIVLRMLLCRRAQPVPVHRFTQLLRASFIVALLVTATYVTDWVAVALRADRSLWTGRTPWLIVALGVVSVASAGAWVLLARTRGLLPRAQQEQPAGDWLDDTRLLADLAAAKLPQPAGRFAAWFGRSGAVEWVRRRATLVVAVGSVFAGLMVATALAKENGFGALFFSEAVWFAGGMYAFGMIANAVLQLTAPPPRARRRRALHIAVISGAAALPVSLGLRGSILPALGISSSQSTTGSVTALTFISALLTGAIVFVAMMRRSHRG